MICVDESWSNCWRGVVGSSCPVHRDDTITDYNRACNIKDYVGSLRTNGGCALVLVDMPLETSVWLRGRTTIVRLFYADRDIQFEDLLSQIDNSIFINPLEVATYDVVSGRMVIFDSALTLGPQEQNFLPFNIEAGRYKILTVTAKPDSRTSVLLHRFFRVN